MKRTKHLEFEFVESFPDVLEQGKLYISMPFATATHKCCCGCGHQVVTPISPKRWTLTYDGESVSLSPSIGNWNFPCQSHYWIRHNRIDWADQWSQERIEAGRDHDQRVVEAFDNRATESASLKPNASAEPNTTNGKPGFWQRFKKWFYSN